MESVRGCVKETKGWDDGYKGELEEEIKRSIILRRVQMRPWVVSGPIRSLVVFARLKLNNLAKIYF